MLRPSVSLLLLAVAALATMRRSAAEEHSCRVLSEQGTEMELVQVLVVHRHGDRTPIATHAGVFKQTSDLEAIWRSRVPPRQEIEAWGRTNVDATDTHLAQTASEKYSFPNGHLTALGASQLRRVGAELRERYVGDFGFLPSALPSATAGVESLVYVRSTRIPRTVQSVQNLLLGLWPPDHRAAGGEIQIQSQEKASDFMTGMNEKRCPRIKQLVAEVDSDLDLPANYSALLGRLDHEVGESSGPANQGLAGSKSSLIDRWIHMGDIGTCHLAHRLTPPLNLSAGDVRALQRYNSWSWGRRLTRSPTLNSLAIGGFIADLLHVLDATVAGAVVPGVSAPKIAVFSGHDSTLLPLLTALGAFDGEWPPYASRIQIELLRPATAAAEAVAGWMVRLVYNGRDASLLGHAPGWLVEYSEFSLKMREFVPKDVGAACMLKRGAEDAGLGAAAAA